MILVLALMACVDPNAPVKPGDDEPFVFEVPKGSSAKSIGPALVEEGLAPSEFKWGMFLRGVEDPACLKAGSFEVRRDMSLNELYGTLCGAPLADDVPFTVVEGWRIRDIDAALVEKGWIDKGEYATVALGKKVDAPFDVSSPSYEGYLYPETYMVSPGDRFDPAKLIERQLETFQERFLAREPDLGERSLDEVVVMASMLEREEPTPGQRPIVAGILWKRIDSGWQLGVDATSRYTLDEWNDRRAFLKKLRDPEDPYNTRIHKGLPPTAIGNPSLSSLEAAVAPKASEYWFYLHDSKGTFHGAKDAAGHERNRKKYNVY